MPRYPRSSSAPTGLSSRVYTSLLTIAQASGREVFALNVGDTYREPPDAASVTALAARRVPGMHRYADVRGEPALREAIMDDHARRGRPLPEARIQVTAGGTSGLDLACRALLEPGDDVIVLAPFWPLIRGIVGASGAHPVEVPFFTELDRPGFDVRATLARALTPRTAAIYVNTPNNPTGRVLDPGTLTTIAELSREHALWLLCDEAYERLHFGPSAAPALWQLEAASERAVTMHTFSKSFGMAGARVAYLHGPEALYESIAGLQTFTTYGAPRPMQLAASWALREGAEWVAESRALYRAAAEKTAALLGVPAPESGTFLFFDTRPFLRDGETAPSLLERVAQAGVVLTPGAASGSAYADWARLCYTAVAPDALERALATLERVLYSRRP